MPSPRVHPTNHHSQMFGLSLLVRQSRGEMGRTAPPANYRVCRASQINSNSCRPHLHVANAENLRKEMLDATHYTVRANECSSCQSKEHARFKSAQAHKKIHASVNCEVSSTQSSSSPNSKSPVTLSVIMTERDITTSVVRRYTHTSAVHQSSCGYSSPLLLAVVELPLPAAGPPTLLMFLRAFFQRRMSLRVHRWQYSQSSP